MVSRPRIRVLLSVACLAMATAAPAYAEDSRLTKQEIIDCLTGKTAMGRDRGLAFRQYFDDDGTIYYRDDLGKSDQGLWRVTDDDEYCAWWAKIGWQCFVVTGEGDRVTWQDRAGGAAISAVMVPGNQLERIGADEKNKTK